MALGESTGFQPSDVGTIFPPKDTHLASEPGSSRSGVLSSRAQTLARFFRLRMYISPARLDDQGEEYRSGLLGAGGAVGWARSPSSSSGLAPNPTHTAESIGWMNHDKSFERARERFFSHLT